MAILRRIPSFGVLGKNGPNFDGWLDRVREGYVRDALQAALAGESIQVYESEAAGFL